MWRSWAIIQLFSKAFRSTKSPRFAAQVFICIQEPRLPVEYDAGLFTCNHIRVSICISEGPRFIDILINVRTNKIAAQTSIK